MDEGLVGWITYWCNGNKEDVTNVKIVDLMKYTLDEEKNCRNE